MGAPGWLFGSRGVAPRRVQGGRLFCWLGLLAFIPSFLVAQPPAETAAEDVDPAYAPGPEAKPDPTLVRQKVALLESYLSSATVSRIEQSGVGDARALLLQARTMLESAEAALAAGKLAQADQEIDRGLRMIASISELTAGGSAQRSKEEEAKRFQTRQDRLRSLIRSLAAITTTEDDPVLKRVDTLMRRAEEFAAAKKYGDANALLKEAYRATATALAERTDGEVVTSRLVFAGPLDELAYERRRFESYELLMALELQEEVSRPAPMQLLIERHVREAQQMKGLAEAAAKAEDFEAAILGMERASQSLIHALQAAGLPVF